MKSLNKIVNVVLALVLLVATTGVTLNKHYCLGRLKSVAVNVAATPCTDMGEEEKMPCCDDISQELKVKEVSTVAFDFDSTPELYLLASIDFTELLASSEINEEDIPPFQEYAPPLPDRDLSVLFQTFLI